MNKLLEWWSNDLPKGVKIVFFLLLANAVPAITILMLLPAHTETLFVWTVKPIINVRLMGVMYANALILVGIGFFQPNWPRVRIVVLLVMLFSILATVLTFFFLKPFLAHPWYHLTYWLTMYFALFFVAPYVFFTEERKHGGRLPVQIPLNLGTKVLAGLYILASLITSLGLVFAVDTVNEFWPWTMPPLVAGMIGVLMFTHAAAFAWALWDGDWLRVRPMFWQAPPTGLLFILLPLLHSSDLKAYAGNDLTLYLVVAALVVVSSLGVIFSYRSAEKALPSHAQ